MLNKAGELSPRLTFYREHKYTGADGTRIVELARELGCQTERVPIKSFGSLSENARIILDWLEAQTAKRVALVSLSKGSADVKTALGLPDAGEAFRCVTTWVSVSGIVQGTPLVAWLQKRPLRWLGVRLLLRFQGHRATVMDDLRREDGAPLASWPQIPVHLRVVHVFGFPLRRHLSHPWAPRAYERLSSMGPNDGGGNLLGDVTRFPGIVFPVWGADHYLGPGWDSRSLLRNILRTAMAEAFS